MDSEDATSKAEEEITYPPLGPLYLTLGIVAMSNTILASALPMVSADLSGASDYTAIVTAYLLPKALATPIGGRLVDAFRPKLVVLGFALAYILTTIACGAAQTMEQLLFLRVIQGIGGGGLLASVYVIVDLLVPPKLQGRVQARISMVFGGGAALAPLVGGVVAEYLGWRWCFWGNVPALLLCVFALARLPNFEAKGALSVDWKGALSLAFCCCPLLLALTWGGVKYPWSSPVTLGLLTLAAVSALIFWKVESRPEEPLFDPRLAKGPIIGWSFVACFCVGGAFLGSLLFLPLFMTVVKGCGPTLAGLSMLPYIIGSIAGAVYGGGQVEDSGHYRTLALKASVSSLIASVLLYLSLQGELYFVIFFALQFVLAFAFGILQGVYGIAVQNDTLASRQGMVGSALEFVRQLGSSLGLSLVGTIFLISLNQIMPSEMNRWLAPLDIKIDIASLEDPAKVEALHNEILKHLTQRVKKAQSEHYGLTERLRKSPLIDERIKADLRSKKSSKPQTETDIAAASEKASAAILSALSQSVILAQARVYLLSALLCLIALLATWRIPDQELRRQLKED